MVTRLSAAALALVLAGQACGQAWYDAAWSNRKQITVDQTKVMATHTDFPLLVSLTDADIKAAARADGWDILFTDDDGTTKLDHEIELWDDATGDLVAWVRIPTLPDNADKDIFLYYGNSGVSATEENATGVWVNYVGVWHLNETSGSRADSTSNNNTLTDQNTVAGVTGRIAGGIDLEESNNERLYITDGAQTGLDITGHLTMQAWVKPESVPGSITFLDKYNGSAAGYRMRVHSNSWYEATVYDGSQHDTRSPIPAATGVWRSIVGVHDGSDMIIYTDGGNTDSVGFSGSITANSEDFEIGARGNDKFFDGLVDEVRIATVARSPQWIQTEFNMVDDPSAFLSAGPVEAGGSVFNYLDPIVDISESTTNSWITVNVASYVPVGATGVMLEVKTESSSDLKFGVRKKLSSGGDTWMWGPDTIKNDTHSWFMIGLDSNREFELIQESSSIDVYLLGYTMPGATFFDNAIDKTPTAGSWQAVDISGDTGADIAIGAIFIIQNTGSSQAWGIQPNGSSDDKGGCGGCGGDLRTNMSTLAIVGVDSGEKCEIRVESSQVKAYLVGYVTTGAVFFNDPVDVSIGAGAYTDIDITPYIGTDDANGAFVQLWAHSDDRHQAAVRKNGAGYDYDKWTSHQFAPVEIDTGDIFEAKTDDTEMEFWLYGYSLTSSGPPQTSTPVNYRSIGTDSGTLASGNGSISSGSTTMTLGTSLPSNVGIGDKITIGGDTFYVKTKDSATEVTVHSAATSTHTNAAYTFKRAYNDIQVWENARDGDLVGESRREVGVCYNDGPFTTTTRFNDSTTDATHYMTLTVAEGQRHNGVAGAGAVIDAGGGFGQSVIDIQDQYTRIEWLEITNWLDADRGLYFDEDPAADNSDGSMASNLLVHDYDAGTEAAMLVRSNGVVIRNCMVYDGPAENAIFAKVGSATVENCTLYGNSDGVKSFAGTTISIRNTVSVGNLDDDFDLEGTVDYFDYNMYSTTEDFTPSGSNDQTPPADLDDLFVSIGAGSEDLHLESLGHNALDTGQDIAGFSNDIDDDTRTAGSWDLGADEVGVVTNYRSVGTQVGTIYSTGDATVTAGSTTVTFAGSANLPANIGQGDELVIGAETLYIKSRDSATQVTLQAGAAGAHTNAAYTISRAYNDFQSWESARQGDLVDSGRREVAVAYDDSVFTAGATIDGSTTDANHYMMITVAPGERHTGIAGSGARIDGQGGTNDIFTLMDPYSRIEWLEVFDFSGDSGTDGVIVHLSGGDNATMQNLLMYNSDPGTALRCRQPATIRNCVIYGSRTAIKVEDNTSAVIENVTIYDSSQEGVDALSGTTVSVTNSISVGNGADDFKLSGTVAKFDYNMYGTLTGPSAGANDQTPPGNLDDLFYSIAVSSENLHLEDSGHDAVDNGEALTSSFTTDIDGATRTVPWDIGADEISGAPLQMTSAADQTFTVGDPDTAIAAITITDHGETPVITAANDLRIKIPAGFNMIWDSFDTVATISGPAAGKVSGSVSYADGDKTLVVDVTADFAASDSVTIADLNFRSFTAATSTANLELDVTNGGAAEATDTRTIAINAAVSLPSGSTVMSWSEVRPTDLPGDPGPPGIVFDNLTPDIDTDDRPSASFSHTIGAPPACGGDPFLIVIVVSRCDQGAVTPNGVTYNSIALIEAVSEETTPGDSGREWVQIFYLTNPPTGTNTVDVQFDSNNNPNAVFALSYFGVDQSDPIGAVNGNSDASSSNPVTVDIMTTVDNSVVVAGMGQHGGDTYQHDHAGDITTERLDQRSGTATGGDSGYAVGEIVTTTTGTYTFEWTGQQDDDWAIACVELNPAE